MAKELGITPKRWLAGNVPLSFLQHGCCWILGELSTKSDQQPLGVWRMRRMNRRLCIPHYAAVGWGSSL